MRGRLEDVGYEVCDLELPVERGEWFVAWEISS